MSGDFNLRRAVSGALKLSLSQSGEDTGREHTETSKFDVKSFNPGLILCLKMKGGFEQLTLTALLDLPLGPLVVVVLWLVFAFFALEFQGRSSV
jgi:hypothetical protein